MWHSEQLIYLRASAVLFVFLFITSTTLAQTQVPTKEHIIHVLSKAPDRHKELLQLGAEAAPAMAECLPLAENPATLLSIIEELNNPAAAKPVMQYINALRDKTDTDADRLLVVRSLDVLGQIGDQRIENDLVALMEDTKKTEPSLAIHAAITIGCIGSEIRRKDVADYVVSLMEMHATKPPSAADHVVQIELSIAAASLCDDPRLFKTSLENAGPKGIAGVGSKALPLMSKNVEKGRLSQAQTQEFLSTVADYLRDSVHNDPFLDYEVNLARINVLTTHREQLVLEVEDTFRSALLDWRRECLQSSYAESPAYQNAMDAIDHALSLLGSRNKVQ